MPVTTMTSRGQLTLPKSVRSDLRLKPGDKLDCFVEPDGSIRIRPMTLKVKDIAGMLGRIRKPARALTIEEMDEGICRAVAERDKRSRR